VCGAAGIDRAGATAQIGAKQIPMSAFIIDLPVPSMGATVSELTVVSIAVTPGTPILKGQKLAELESDKSAFDFESPAAGTILEVKGVPGAVMISGQALFRMETEDASLRHLEVAALPAVPVAGTGVAHPVGAAGKTLQWTPRALKLAAEAGFDHTHVVDIEATGPGGRVSGDDVVKYLASRK
jgi:pyruvate/2-oxoglutarate dehydrogenase complex dihydrolipoamide acyltransferase (E2) component